MWKIERLKSQHDIYYIIVRPERSLEKEPSDYKYKYFHSIFAQFHLLSPLQFAKCTDWIITERVFVTDNPESFPYLRIPGGILLFDITSWYYFLILLLECLYIFIRQFMQDGKRWKFCVKWNTKRPCVFVLMCDFFFKADDIWRETNSALQWL